MTLKVNSIKINSTKSNHGKSKHPLYRKWHDMKKRCYNKNVDRYKSYGGVGIKVCDEWKNSFISFYDWSISNGWKPGLTIERIDISKDYSPSNCKYISMKEQAYNKKNTYYVIINNKKFCLSKLLLDNNLSYKYKVVWLGLKQGRTIEYYVKKLNIKI